MMLTRIKGLLRPETKQPTEIAADGLPLPPSELRFLVAGTDDADWFLEGGMLAIQSIQDTLHKNGVPIEQFQAILDFGCGSGRVTRHWQHMAAAIYGSDYNKVLIRWCQKNLSFGRFTTNRLKPPLPYQDKNFDFIYALSVFTHLPEILQLAWIKELSRVLKSGGYLLLTTHGEFYLDRLTDEGRKQFRAGQLVVHHHRKAGKNLCAAFHPLKYVQEKLANGFTVIDFIAEGAKGNPRQDIYLLRKPAPDKP